MIAALVVVVNLPVSENRRPSEQSPSEATDAGDSGLSEHDASFPSYAEAGTSQRLALVTNSCSNHSQIKGVCTLPSRRRNHHDLEVVEGALVLDASYGRIAWDGRMIKPGTKNNGRELWIEIWKWLGGKAGTCSSGYLGRRSSLDKSNWGVRGHNVDSTGRLYWQKGRKGRESFW